MTEEITLVFNIIWMIGIIVPVALGIILKVLGKVGTRAVFLGLAVSVGFAFGGAIYFSFVIDEFEQDYSSLEIDDGVQGALENINAGGESKAYLKDLETDDGVQGALENINAGGESKAYLKDLETDDGVQGALENINAGGESKAYLKDLETDDGVQGALENINAGGESKAYLKDLETCEGVQVALENINATGESKAYLKDLELVKCHDSEGGMKDYVVFTTEYVEHESFARSLSCDGLAEMIADKTVQGEVRSYARSIFTIKCTDLWIKAP